MQTSGFFRLSWETLLLEAELRSVQDDQVTSIYKVLDCYTKVFSVAQHVFFGTCHMLSGWWSEASLAFLPLGFL